MQAELEYGEFSGHPIAATTSTISRSSCKDTGLSAKNMKSARLSALFILIALAACLRSYRLGATPVLPDEAFSWCVASRPVGDLLRRIAADTHPPGYFLLLKGWVMLFGHSPIALRAPSVICGALSVAFAYLLVSQAADDEITGKFAALLCGALIAIHPSFVEIGRLARMYSGGVLLTIVSSWLLLRALNKPVLIRWIAFSASSTVLLYLHFFAVFTVAGQFLFAMGPLARGSCAKDRVLPIRTIVSFCIPIMCFAPWFWAMCAQIARVSDGFWLAHPTLPAVIDALFLSIAGCRAAHAFGAVSVLAVAGGALVLAIRRRKRATVFFLFLAGVPWVCALGASAICGLPLFHERYLVFAQVGLVATCALATSALSSTALRLIWSIALGFSVSVGALAFLNATNASEPVIRRAVAHLTSRATDRHWLLVSDPLNYVVFQYELAEANVVAMPVLCDSSARFACGQISHIAAVDHKSFFAPDARVPDAINAVWCVGAASPPAGDWIQRDMLVIEPETALFEPACCLRLFVRSESHEGR